MREAYRGGWRAVLGLVLLALCVPTAAAEGPGQASSTPAAEQTPPFAPPAQDGTTSATTTSETAEGPPGQGCRPACFDMET